MLAAFVGPVPLAEAAGVPVVQVTRALHSGKPTPHAQMALSRLTLESLDGCSLFNSKGATLRLRSLYALGYSTPLLGSMMNTGHRQVGEILNGERAWVRAATHNRAKYLFDGVGMAPVPEGNWADNARARALERGWLRPIELEEDLLDVPEPWASDMLADRAQEMSHADQIKSMKVVRAGERSELAVAAYEAYKVEYNRRKREGKAA